MHWVKASPETAARETARGAAAEAAKGAGQVRRAAAPQRARLATARPPSYAASSPCPADGLAPLRMMLAEFAASISDFELRWA